jgi:hypothetical protein
VRVGGRRGPLRVVVGATIAVAALVGCGLFYDFDGYEASQSLRRDAGPPDTSAPFRIASVAPSEIKGQTGRVMNLSIRLERRAGFRGKIVLGLVEGGDLRLDVRSPTDGDVIEAELTLGAVLGKRAFGIEGRSDEAPGFSTSFALEAVVRGAPGALDTTFGDGGIVELEIPSVIDDVVVTDDDGIAVSGIAGASPAQDLTVARLDVDGAPDPAFGARTGVARLERLDPGPAEATTSVLVRVPEGLVVAGQADSAQIFRLFLLDRSGALADAGAPRFGPARGCRGLAGDDGGVIIGVDGSLVWRALVPGAAREFGDGGTSRLPGAADFVFSETNERGVPEIITRRLEGLARVTLAPNGALTADELIPVACDNASLSKRGLSFAGGRLFLHATCREGIVTPASQPTALLVALEGNHIDPGFNRGEPLRIASLGAVGVTVTPSGIVTVATRGATERAVVMGRGLDGSERWSVRSGALGMPPDVTIRSLAVDGLGRVVLAGDRQDKGVGVVIRFWD